MNLRRGLYRLLAVFTLLWFIFVGSMFFGVLQKEFVKASLNFPGEILLPMQPSQVRGSEGADYTCDSAEGPNACWYRLSTFRILFPEYKDLGEKELSDKMYPAAGIERHPAEPWQMLWRVLLVALALPVLLLILGELVAWIYRGFRGKS